jgi:hypothetical protein
MEVLREHGNANLLALVFRVADLGQAKAFALLWAVGA